MNRPSTLPEGTYDVETQMWVGTVGSQARENPAPSSTYLNLSTRKEPLMKIVRVHRRAVLFLLLTLIAVSVSIAPNTAQAAVNQSSLSSLIGTWKSGKWRVLIRPDGTGVQVTGTDECWKRTGNQQYLSLSPSYVGPGGELTYIGLRFTGPCPTIPGGNKWVDVTIELSASQNSFTETFRGMVNYRITWSRESGYSENVSHGYAMTLLSAAGIPVVASGCGSNVTTCANSTYVSADRTRTNGTSLEQVRLDALLGIIEFNNRCRCGVIITGGTETWIHASTDPGHHTGHKLDIRPSSALDTFIVNNYGPSSTHSGSSYPAYENNTPSGEVFFDERNTAAPHWDILYP